ncbi:MAG TPA: UvrD-helicase domain-containing protein [Candidatus Dormibacteraeota bacterium]|nr:UvrD-helicase domain-containing protein [Candidatus Dormibacteraeota bacterium]
MTTATRSAALIEAGLTPNQRLAVEHLHGPLLIIAGAGTGKTRVLVERYRRLRQEGVEAEQILLLTFTEKAAREVLDRVELHDYLPTGERFVMTYHAFAQRFLQEEGWLGGLPKGFRIVSEVRKWELMRDTLLALRPPHLFHAQRPYERIRELLLLIERAKQELVSPAEFVAWSAAVPDADDPAVAAQREAAAVYAEYQRRMLAEERLDFDDTIFYSVQLLSDEPAVRRRQTVRFTQIMVDEFQDTNFAQSRLLELLAGEQRNLAVVGDDDQSIYKFRGASVANLKRFGAVFPDAAVVHLEENFRSRGPILRAAGRLIASDAERLAKRLTPTRGEGVPLSVVTASSVSDEADAVAAYIKRAIDEDRYHPSAIAVLLRANAHLQNFARALQRIGVAYQVSGGRGFYQQPEVKDCLAYLRAIDNPDDTVCLMRLLSLPRYAVDPIQAGRWAHRARDLGRRFFDILEEGEDDGARRLTTDLRSFTGLALRLGVDELFFHLMEQTRYLDWDRFQGSIEQLQVSANVQKLSELISAYCDEHKDHHLGAYLRHLDATEAAQADEEIAPLDETVNAVHLMTVHQAKGLEFGLVIIPHLVEGRFPATRRSEGLTLPNDLIKEELPPAELHLAEERRLAYVAITRAREEVVCTLAGRYEGVKDWRPSRFLPLIQGDDSRQLAASSVLLPSSVGLVEMARQVELPLNDAPPLAALSYTQVDTYLRCPQMYQYRFVFRLPTRPRPQMQFGRILHEALKDALGGIERDRPLTWDMVDAAYVSAWARERFCAPEQAPSLQDLGRSYLRRAYEAGDLSKPLLLEQPFSLRVDGLRLTGRIDRVDRHPDGSYELIDYKTGSAKRAADLQRDLQLGVYALAARDVFRFDPLSLSYYYLETAQRVTVDKPPERLREDRETIGSVAEGIRAERFPAKPDRMKCAGCDFRLLCPSAAV